MAARVNRTLERERRAFDKGETISVRRPATFTADDAPGSTVQDIATETVTLTLDTWKEVTYALTDKELAWSSEQVVAEHIMPAAYAIADAIDQSLCARYKDVPWFTDLTATPIYGDIVDVRKVMFDNKVPLADPTKLHFMCDGATSAAFLKESAFSQYQGAGDTGISTQMRGQIGMKGGLNLFEAQNVQTHTKGTASTGTLALTADADRGATSVGMDAVSVTGTLVAGDTFVIAGNSQRYSVTATSTASGNTFTTVSFTPGLAQDHLNNDVVTVSLDNHTANLAFHRDAFALVVAPLTDNTPGAATFTATDPVSGLSVRACRQWNVTTKKNTISLDALWGVKTLNPNLAVRARG